MKDKRNDYFTIEGRVCLTIEGRLSSIHYNMLG